MLNRGGDDKEFFIVMVALIGFMGCGKSSVARVLAADLGCAAVDLDDLIIAREGASIAEVFACRGEDAFRKIETEVLREALQHKAQRVIASGGGVVARAENRALLKNAARAGVLVVYLQADSKTLAARIRRQPGLRPLIDGGDAVLDLAQTERRVQELLEIRAPLYQDVASFVLETAGLAPAQIAREIERELAREMTQRDVTTRDEKSPGL